MTSRMRHKTPLEKNTYSLTQCIVMKPRGLRLQRISPQSSCWSNANPHSCYLSKISYLVFVNIDGIKKKNKKKVNVQYTTVNASELLSTTLYFLCLPFLLLRMRVLRHACTPPYSPSVIDKKLRFRLSSNIGNFVWYYILLFI